MTGTRLAFERLGDAADVDPGARPWRIHQLGPRLVDRVHLTLTQQSRVAIRIARIASEVLARPELDRVHENADDHDIVLASRELDQTQVPGMQGAHRRHEPNRSALGAPPARGVEHRAGCLDDGRGANRRT